MEPWDRPTSDDIKVGDRFLVEVEVSSDGGTSYLGCVPRGGEPNDQFSVHRSVLSAAKRLPRALRVRDRVQVVGGYDRGTILAIDGDAAWVHWGRDERLTYLLSDLTLAEEAR